MSTGAELVNRIDYFLNIKGEKRPQMCAALGLTHSSISRWSSRDSLPDALTIVRIAQYLGTTAEFLVTGKNTDLAPEQRALLYKWDILTEEQRQAVSILMEGFLSQNEKKSAQVSG